MMMRPSHVLFSAVQFIFVAVLFLLGGLFIGLGYAPALRASLADFMTGDTTILSLVGCALMGCSLLLTFGFYAMYRGAYYHVQMERPQVSIDSKIVEELVQRYWKQKFPEFQVEVVLRGKKQIEVLAEMAEMDLESQAVLLSEVELELGALLEHSLGHNREWIMTVLAK